MNNSLIAILFASLIFWAFFFYVCLAHCLEANDCDIAEIYMSQDGKHLHTTLRCMTEDGEIFYKLKDAKVEVVSETP